MPGLEARFGVPAQPDPFLIRVVLGPGSDCPSPPRLRPGQPGTTHWPDIPSLAGMEEIPDSGSAGFTMARPSGLGVQEVDHILSLSHLDRVASVNNFDPILQESSLKSHALGAKPVPSEELQIE
jgi:hypothetical protein